MSIESGDRYTLRKRDLTRSSYFDLSADDDQER